MRALALMLVLLTGCVEVQTLKVGQALLAPPGTVLTAPDGQKLIIAGPDGAEKVPSVRVPRHLLVPPMPGGLPVPVVPAEPEENPKVPV